MELSEIRSRIDQIDEQLLKLFLERMDLAEDVASQKMEQSLPVLNQTREKEILDRVTEQAGDRDTYVRSYFAHIMDLSKSLQKQMIYEDDSYAKQILEAQRSTPQLFPHKATVAVQGVQGSYSTQAAEKLFAMPRILYFKNFSSVFDAVEKGLCEFGILPIENSSNGSVKEIYDLIKEKKFHIARGYKLNINHELLANKGTKLEDVKDVYSHSQALEQCSRFLKEYDWIQHSVSNTAEAARFVSQTEDLQSAAVASHNCAELYDLTVLKRDIQNNANNYTRFICITKELRIYPGANKISIMMPAAHKPGGLYTILAKFATLGLNLTKLESRPMEGSNFEFMFYFDFEGSVLMPRVTSLLSELYKEEEAFVFLGNYMEVS